MKGNDTIGSTLKIQLTLVNYFKYYIDYKLLKKIFFTHYGNYSIF